MKKFNKSIKNEDDQDAESSDVLEKSKISSENDNEIGQENMYKPDVTHRGYEDTVSFNDIIITNPRFEANSTNSSAIRNAFEDIPILTEVEARQVLSGFLDKKLFHDKKYIEKVLYNDLQSSNAFKYILHSFVETRTTQWIFEPFQSKITFELSYTSFTISNPYCFQDDVFVKNEVVPPLPWQIPVQAKSLFSNETVILEVPNSTIINKCKRCFGCGKIKCNSCCGRGKKKCTICGGEGEHRCYNRYRAYDRKCYICLGDGFHECKNCKGSGKVTCIICKGTTQLKWTIKLTVKFEDHVDCFLKKSEDVPDELLKSCQSKCIFSEEDQILTPISHHPDQDINKASYDLIQHHLLKFQNSRIIAQRHEIEAIPITLCKYSYNNEKYQYFVYGVDKKIHIVEHPKVGFDCSIS